MKKFFVPLAALTAAMFAYAPIAIANAPYESTMLLIQKIFYFHVPSWMAMYAGIAVCGAASVVYLFKSRPAADRLAVAAAELIVLFGAIGLVTGPLWGRKAWGVWWQWDARLTMALLLERLALLLPLLACGTIGFAAVGTLFAAMLMRARTRDVMLPILLYPITIPVIIAGVRGTSALLATPPDQPTTIMWLTILLCFDVVFVTLALWTFEPLMTE